MKRIVKSLLLAVVISLFVGSVSAFAASCYWVGDNANPDWELSSVWASSSGGAQGSCPAVGGTPDGDDRAVFDFNSNTYPPNTVSMPVELDYLTVTTYTGAISFSSTVDINNILQQQSGTINFGNSAVDIRSLDLEGGSMNAGSNYFTLANISYVQGGALDAESAYMTFNGELEVSSGSIDFSDANLVDFNGSFPAGLDFDGGTIDGPTDGTITVEDRFEAEVGTTFNANGCTFEFDGAQSYSLLKAQPNTLENIKINKTNSAHNLIISGVSNLDILGDLTLTQGTLDLDTYDPDFTLGGDWIMTSNGDLSVSSSSVIFDNTTQAQTIYGSTTFYDLEKISPNQTLYFEGGSVQTVTGTATLNGASGQLLTLASDTPGVSAEIKPTSEDIDYVDI